MAVNKAPAAKPSTSAQAGGEVSEREYQATINDAIRDTEGEIAAAAFDEDEPENDGDTSLEEMGEGLEGEVEDDAEEDVDGDGEEEAEGDAEDGDGEEAEADEGEAEDGEQPEADRDARGRFERQDDRRIPPSRLREEADRRRSVEERNSALERQVAEMNGRLAELSARTNAPPPRQAEAPPPKPDPFSDPEGYERWVFDQAERRVESRLEQRLSQFQQQQQAREAERVDASLARAATGPRAFEFSRAYGALTSLDRNSPQARATVARIYNSGDGAEQALWDWWEQNGGPEYRDQIAEQLGLRPPRNGRGRGPDDRSGDRRGDQPQPRHVIRGPQRLPSLNSATGSNSQRISDPEMLDGSERAIFEYGTRR